jgi:feruloyl esterase
LGVTVVLGALTSPPSQAQGAASIAPVTDCASLASLSLPNTQILSATQVAATTALPAYCSLTGVINERVSAQDPDHYTYGIGFKLNLPEAWVGRFEVMGGGGNDGSVANPLGTEGIELSQGWAVAKDDGGHEDVVVAPFTWSDDDANAGGAQHFALDAQARSDYGYNGIERTAQISKHILQAYYGRGADHSYLLGCSNGGRDAMMAAERFPELFDGIVAGNPGFDLPRAGLAEAYNEQALAPLATRFDVNNQPYIPDTFPPQDLQVVSAAILSACDALDGLVDGIVDNFPACTSQRVYPALAAYTCAPGGAHGNVPHGGSCITSAQVSALKKIFEGTRNSSGEQLYSGWFWDAGIWDPAGSGGAGFATWNVGSVQPTGSLSNNALNLTLGAGSVPMIFTTPPVSTPVSGPNGQEAYLFGLNFDRDASAIYRRAPGYPESAMDFMAATSTNLQHFKRRGGRLIVYSSVNDGIFSGVDIVDWYRSLNDTMGGDAQRFARLFMVPNMAHCGGGPATNIFGANMLSSITGWVEGGVAPERIVAANASTSPPFPESGLFDPLVAHNFPYQGTRPLCPFPKQSRYTGSGSTADASNFVCVRPGGEHRGDSD